MTNEITIREDLKQGSMEAVSNASLIQVIDQTTSDRATDFIKTLKKFQAEIKSELRPAIEKANELHKHLTSQEKRLLAPLQEAERVIKMKVATFLTEMENKRREEQRRIQAQAEAEERKRREELEKQAKKHEEAGRVEKAEERRALAEQVHIPVPIVEEAAVQGSGVSTRQNWKYEIINADLIPREYMIPDEVAIRGQVRALKGKAKIPGVRIYAESTLSVRV